MLYIIMIVEYLCFIFISLLYSYYIVNLVTNLSVGSFRVVYILYYDGL